MGTPPPTNPPAADSMTCRACGREERASEGYPCDQCGTFLCLICMFRGVTLCKSCAAAGSQTPPPAGAT